MLRERGIGINPAQGRILFVLWDDGPTTIHELAKRSGLAKSSLTTALDRLEAQGQVVRVRGRDDRRKILIELTPGNHAMRRLYDQVSREMVDLFYRGFRPPRLRRSSDPWNASSRTWPGAKGESSPQRADAFAGGAGGTPVLLAQAEACHRQAGRRSHWGHWHRQAGRLSYFSVASQAWADVRAAAVASLPAR